MMSKIECHHVVKVFLVGNRDEGFEVLIGELVLEGDVTCGVKEGGELGKHVDELDVAGVRQLVALGECVWCTI